MKNKILHELKFTLAFPVMVLLLIMALVVNGQEVTIWTEDFNDEVNNAVVGSGTPKFSLDGQYDWSTDNTSLKVKRTGNVGQLEGSNIEEGTWQFNYDVLTLIK